MADNALPCFVSSNLTHSHINIPIKATRLCIRSSIVCAGEIMYYSEVRPRLREILIPSPYRSSEKNGAGL